MKRTSTHLLLALALALLAGCSSSSSNTGSAQFAVSVPQALSARDVTRVQVTVSASDMSSLAVDLAKSSGSWGGQLGNIPAGSNRSFLAQAFDSSGTLRFQGQASGVTLTANQTTAVAITLQEVSPPPPYGNEAPVIDSLVASSTSVQTGSALSLTATVHDPNPGDSLTLAWTASGGTFSASSAATTSWTAPSTTGVQTLTFTVTDSQGAAVSVSVSVSVNVLSGASTGNAALNISFNLWPTVSKVSASLNRLDAGQPTSVSALASDADGDALSYQWTASCPGTWTNATSSAASFVPSSVPAGSCNNCRLTVTVQDGRGGQTTGALALCVATSSTERFPPSFTNSYQSATSTSAGQTVAFDVTALDPQSSSLTFAWSANTGSLGTPANGATTSRITWTAPACVSASTTITATVTNAFNLTAIQSFTVTGLPVCVAGWASTGSMAAPRYDHTATLLNNGKVLVAGGYKNDSGDLATAEVYDPSSGTWSPTGSMTAPRRFHSAALLPNGKVLVAGGQNTSGFLATAEVYDPSSGTWSSTGPLALPRSRQTETLLNTGKILVTGGIDASVNTLATAEVYDPASGSWSVTGSMASPRRDHVTVLLPNGKVLVEGGFGYGNGTSAEVYDPASGTWSATGSLSATRWDHKATLLSNGKVLVVGGSNLATAEVYDPASGTWSATGSMSSPRSSNHVVTRLSNGKVLVVGGYTSSSGALATAEVYDPASGTWSSAGSMSTSRWLHTATPLTNGRVLVAGGASNSSELATAELYTP